MRVTAPVREASSAPMWIPTIQRTVATEGKGIPELGQAIAKHVEHLTQSGVWDDRERARLEVELDALIREELVIRFRQNVSEEEYTSMLGKILHRELSPGEAVKLLLNGRMK